MAFADGATPSHERSTSVGRLAEDVCARISSDVISERSWVEDTIALVPASLSTLSVNELRSLASDVGWRLRDLAIPLSPYPVAGGGPGAETRFAVYLVGQVLRYNFRFRELSEWAEHHRHLLGDDALLLGHLGFGALGRYHSAGLSFVDASIQLPDADRRSRHVCLHALWFATDQPDQAERILRLSDEMLARGEEDANVHYRRAFAFRRSNDFSSALTAIHRAFELHTGSVQVHQDYVRERELIVTSQLIHEESERLRDQVGSRIEAQTTTLLAQLDDRAEALQERFALDLRTANETLTAEVSSAREMMTDGLTKNIEMLGLFVTLAAVLVGSGAAIIRSDNWAIQTRTIVLMLAASVIFFVLLRLVVSSPLPGRLRGGSAGARPEKPLS